MLPWPHHDTHQEQWQGFGQSPSHVFPCLSALLLGLDEHDASICSLIDDHVLKDGLRLVEW